MGSRQLVLNTDWRKAGLVVGLKSLFCLSLGFCLNALVPPETLEEENHLLFSIVLVGKYMQRPYREHTWCIKKQAMLHMNQTLWNEFHYSRLISGEHNFHFKSRWEKCCCSKNQWLSSFSFSWQRLFFLPVTMKKGNRQRRALMENESPLNEGL